MTTTQRTGGSSKQRAAGIDAKAPARVRATRPSPRSAPAVSVGGIAISTPARPVFPALGFSKLDLAQYYLSVSSACLDYLAGRPLTLVRCEHGATRTDALRTECKFLRHEPGWHRWVPPAIQRVNIQEQKKLGEYLVVNSAEGLVALAQGGIVEIHAWNSKADDPEHPDRFVLDLDPAPDVAWSDVVEAAHAVRARLEAVGLECWPKLTGGKGIHVVAPFRPELGWDEVFGVTRIVAESLVRDTPALFTTTFGKARRSGKILLDYKRNHRAAVAVAAYSPRAMPGGAVSAPVSWEQLDQVASSQAFTVKDVVKKQLARGRDPWRDYFRCRQSLRSTLSRRRTTS